MTIEELLKQHSQDIKEGKHFEVPFLKTCALCYHQANIGIQASIDNLNKKYE